MNLWDAMRHEADRGRGKPPAPDTVRAAHWAIWTAVVAATAAMALSLLTACAAGQVAWTKGRAGQSWTGGGTVEIHVGASSPVVESAMLLVATDTAPAPWFRGIRLAPGSILGGAGIPIRRYVPAPQPRYGAGTVFELTMRADKVSLTLPPLPGLTLHFQSIGYRDIGGRIYWYRAGNVLTRTIT